MTQNIFESVTIVGAGAIGGRLGAQLAEQGVRVSLLARGATLDALQKNGLRLRSADAEQRYQLPATSDAATLGVQDLVVVAVKAPTLPDIARSIGPLLGPDTVVLTAMNGVPWWFFQG